MTDAKPARLLLKITLRNVEPSIWRRIAVVDDLTLAQLHRVIQEAFGWEDCHLHEYEIGSARFGRPEFNESPFGDSGMLDERKSRLAAVIGSHPKFTYWYDFGDDWFHDVVVEERQPMTGGGPRAELVAGERAGPPEDCGGPYGYAELVEAMRDRKHPEHAEMREWIGEFDPDVFDIDAARRRVAKVIRPRAKTGPKSGTRGA
jgi:hypothetical protein